MIREPHKDSTSNRDPHDDAGFVPLDSTGDLAVITDTNGRSASAELVAAAKRYVELSVPSY